MKPRTLETTIGAAVVAWLLADQWEVFQEVKGGRERDAPIADIVARRARVTWIIECKTTLSQELLDQCMYWQRRGFAHFVSCATPRGKMSAAAEFVLSQFGIGHLKVSEGTVSRHPWLEPRLIRPLRFAGVDYSIAQYLHDDQRSRVKAGSPGRYASTPFTRTCEQLRELVAAGPVAVKDAIAQLNHHYQSDATARASLVHWAEQGNVRGVRLAREGRRVWFAKAV